MVVLLIPAIGKWRQEDYNFKDILGYIACLKLAWATQHPVSKQQQ